MNKMLVNACRIRVCTSRLLSHNPAMLHNEHVPEHMHALLDACVGSSENKMEQNIMHAHVLPKRVRVRAAAAIIRVQVARISVK